MPYEDTPEQIAGRLQAQKDMEEKTKALKEKYNAISPARQKAIDHVMQKKKEKEIRDKFYNNTPNEKTNP